MATATAAIAAMAIAGCDGARTAADPAALPALVLCPDRACVAVDGLPPAVLARLRDDTGRMRQALAVYVAPSGDAESEAGATAGATPMLGRHELGADGRLLFRPRLGFAAGVAYRAVFTPAALGLADRPAHTLRFTLPSPHPDPPRLISVSPPGPAVPANLLRIYLHFDRPMDPRGAAVHVRLLDREGAPIPLAFVPIPEGLWDGDRTRATLLLHPGRVKRGVAPGQALGPVLTPGDRVTLEVDGAWRDAWGEPLGRARRTDYAIGAFDRTPVDPRRWRLTPPAAGTREPLLIAFDETLDGALAHRGIAVHRAVHHRAGGARVRGVAAVAGDGRSWSFEPDRPWPRERHAIRVDPRLEDLAGNTVRRLFDRQERSDPSAEPDRTGAQPLAFEVSFQPRQQ